METRTEPFLVVSDSGPCTTLGSRQLQLASATTTDLTPPTGTKRIVVIIPPGAAGATIPVRIRCGVSGAASNTADLTTVVPPTSVYTDVVAASLLTGTAAGAAQVVEIRTSAPMTWVRFWNSIAATHNVYVYFYSNNVEARF